jgi:hypothetical protein
MTDHLIHDLVTLLADRLAEPATTADDFVRLAAAGEPVRRAVALLGAMPADVDPQLAAYETALTTFRGPIPATLDDDATAVAADLDAYRGADDSDGDAGLSLILELDAIVSTIATAERIGRLAHGTTDTLAARLGQTLAGVSYRAPHLAQLAEDRWLTIGDDPDLVGAYRWLDVLAEAAPSRSRVDAVVKSASRVDEALQILSRARPLERARSAMGRLPPFAVARHVPLTLYATTNVSVPKQTPLVEEPDLNIFLEESIASLLLVVAFAPPLWIDDARAALDNVVLSRVNAGPHEFRFILPNHGGQLHLEIQLEDDFVAQDLELRRPT